MTAIDLTCPDCGARMVLRTAQRGALAGKPFYGCSTWPTCNATHGAHPDGKPLGIPGDRATKDARIRAHAAFDRIWLSGLMSRRGAYSWMRHRLGLSDVDGHIGRFDVAACERLIALVATLRLDDEATHEARMQVKWLVERVVREWSDRRKVWRTVAEILGVEGSVYLVELTAEQCAEVQVRLSERDADRMRHGEHDGEGRISGSHFSSREAGP